MFSYFFFLFVITKLVLTKNSRLFGGLCLVKNSRHVLHFSDSKLRPVATSSFARVLDLTLWATCIFFELSLVCCVI